jgi:hypothetical protein
MNDAKKEKSRCNKCNRNTWHVICFHELVENEVMPLPDETSNVDWRWWEDHTLLRCCGCDDFTYRVSFWHAYTPTGLDRKPKAYVKCYPPRIARQKPKWSLSLPDGYEQLFDEVYSAVNSENLILAMMGARALLEMFIRQKVGDRGQFRAGLDALVEERYLAPVNRPILESAIEAGSASAHRAYVPTQGIMDSVMDIVENLLQYEVLRDYADDLNEVIPPRPPRKKKPKKETTP